MVENAKIKKEVYSLSKTLGAIAASFDVVWGYVEPIVQDYVHNQVKIVQEEDKRLIKELSNRLEQEKEYNKTRRNDIIQEINYFYNDSRLRIEK